MDLYTISVQLINFVILVLILNKFLYKPLLTIIDSKKKAIEKQNKEIEDNLNESDILKNKYLDKLKEFDKEKQKLKSDALIELENFKNEEIAKINKEIDKERQKLTNQIEVEKKSLIEDYNSFLLDLVIKYSNTILINLSNTNLQDQIINKFLEKVENLSSEKINEINKNLQSSTINIYSNDSISDNNKEIIKNFLLKKGFNFKDIQYSINTDLLLGIELKANSNVIFWNIKEISADFKLKINKDN